MISPLLVSLPGQATPEEVLRRPPREAWPLARVLDALLMKMGRTACWLSHAVDRRQASLGTPVPRTPTASACHCAGECHLEVALSAQRLAQQDTIDIITHVYAQIVHKDYYMQEEDDRTLAFLDRRATLDGIV